MKTHNLFLGRPVYWLLAAFVTAALAGLGYFQQHVKEFVTFQFAVLGLAVLVVVVILKAYQPGEQITREPLDPEHDD